MPRHAALLSAALALLALLNGACAEKMANLPLPSGPKKTTEVNPWTTGQKFPVIEAQCGDAIVFTWTPSETHGVARMVAPPTKKNGTLSCACPAMAGNGTVAEGLMLAPVTKGGSYRYIVINETEPFCVVSQAQGDCKKGMAQVVKPSCPPAAAVAASSASAVAAALAAKVVAVVAAVAVAIVA